MQDSMGEMDDWESGWDGKGDLAPVVEALEKTGHKVVSVME